MSTVSEKPVSRNEGIKEASRYLRGTIADGLADAITGAISEDDAQLTKFHGTYLQDDRDLRPERRKKKLEQAYSFMVRVRVPGGVCTPAQWLALDRRRQRLRQRHAAPDHPPGLPVPRRDQEQPQAHHAGDQRRTLLDTIAACGDVNRNVMCNPNPHQSQAHAAGARAGARDQRPPDAAHRRLSRDLAGRREGRRQRGRGGPIYGQPLPAAQIQDRGGGAAQQRRRRVRAGPGLHRHHRCERARWSAGTSRSAAAWA